MKKYTLSYLSIFNTNISDTWEYVTYRLKNPEAANRLIADVEAAILKRQTVTKLVFMRIVIASGAKRRKRLSSDCNVSG